MSARIFIVVTAVGLVVYFGASFWGIGQSARGPEAAPPSTKSPPVTASEPARPRVRPPQVSALGRLEPKGGLLDVGGMTGDRIGKLLVSEGDEVAADAPLAELESLKLREAELKAARSALVDAQRRQPLERNYGSALVQAAEAGKQQADLLKRDRALLEAKVAVTSAALEVARADLARLIAVDGKIVSLQDREHQQLRVKQAEAEAAAAQAEIDKLTAGLTASQAQADAKLAEAKAGSARLEASLQLDLLQQQVSLAEEKLKMSEIRAPRAGRVLKILTRPGETVSPQRPVLRLGDTNQMVAVCEVYETQVWCVEPNQKATITSRALEKPLHGVVTFVGQIVAKNEVLSIDPTKAADNRVVEVLIDIQEDAEAARLVNLQVDVVIETPGQ